MVCYGARVLVLGCSFLLIGATWVWFVACAVVLMFGFDFGLVVCYSCTVGGLARHVWFGLLRIGVVCAVLVLGIWFRCLALRGVWWVCVLWFCISGCIL